MNGHGKEALKYFEQICTEGVQPDDTNSICLLSACRHAGLVDEGMHCYSSMVTDYMISAKLEHYTCMVDLLCHGHLQEVENMVMAVPWKLHVAHGWLYFLLAEFMVMWRWQNVLPEEFLKWNLTMLLIMDLCCCWQRASL
jgi:hypothetical protein